MKYSFLKSLFGIAFILCNKILVAQMDPDVIDPGWKPPTNLSGQIIISQMPTLPTIYAQKELKVDATSKAKLAKQREFIVKNKLGFNVGVTSTFGKPIGSITGEAESSLSEVIRIKNYLLTRTLKPITWEIIKKWLLSCNTSRSYYDARLSGLITPVKEQKCINCWTYGAIGAYETSYKKVNNLVIDASEQQAGNCTDSDACDEGLAYWIFEWMVNNNKNLNTEAASPDLGVNIACPAADPATNYFATDWGICSATGDISKIASVDEIKKAICTYGSVSASLNATDLFSDYTNGVFYETPSNYASPTSNHAILIIGWDDSKNAWLIKNSWNTTWGEGGYGWVDYNTNNIGRRAAWVLAKPR
jgi:cathepsin L